MAAFAGFARGGGGAALSRAAALPFVPTLGRVAAAAAGVGAAAAAAGAGAGAV
eukprot:gene11952-11568_t